MSVTTNHMGLKSPGPLMASSWLDWSRDDGEYVGGEYRIRLIEPYRWEVGEAALLSLTGGVAGVGIATAVLAWGRFTLSTEGLSIQANVNLPFDN